MFSSGRLLEVGTLGAYLTLLLWIGLRSSRQVRTSIDYTLAGRDVPWLVVLATTAATMVGGGASLGMVSKVYVIGIAPAIMTCAWHLQLIFTGLWVAPKLRELNLITVSDYFALKFGEIARLLAIFNCILFLVGALTAQMAAIGMITYSVLGVPYEVALIIGAAVTVFYSTVGGIRAVVKTDVLQFVILVVGISAASAILFVKNGGFEGLSEHIDAAHFNITGHWSWIRIVSLFCAFLLGEAFVPPYTVRCFIAKNSRHARWGVAGGGIFLLLFLPVATFTLGASARSDLSIGQTVQQEKQHIEQAAQEAGSSISSDAANQQAAQLAYPTLIRNTFYPAFAGIVIAALIAAVMSSADSCLSCLATVMMEDIYRRHVHPRASDMALLRVAKWSTLLTGITAAGCAYYYRDIADLLEFVYDFWAPAMVLPFLIGTFWYKTSRVYAVVISMIAGLAAAAVWRFALHSPWDLGPALLGFRVAVATFFIALPLTCRLPLSPLFQPESSPVPTDQETT